MLKIGRRDKEAREFMTNVFSINRIGKYSPVGKIQKHTKLLRKQGKIRLRFSLVKSYFKNIQTLETEIL